MITEGLKGEGRLSQTLSADKGMALHRQVFLVLRDQIVNGVFETTSALPTEEMFCKQFGVSSITVRRALADLAAQGLIERRQGVGTFVRAGSSPSRERPSLSLVESLRTTIAATQPVEVLSVESETPPASVAAFLTPDSDAKAVHIIRMRSSGGAPVMLTDAWVPSRLAKGITPASLRKHSLTQVLISRGVEFGRVVQEITAVVADPWRSQMLGVEVGTPLLKLIRLMHDQGARPVEHLTVYLSPERSRILMEMQASEVDTLSAGRVVYDAAAET